MQFPALLFIIMLKINQINETSFANYYKII